jgi:hypothetical protein
MAGCPADAGGDGRMAPAPQPHREVAGPRAGARGGSGPGSCSRPRGRPGRHGAVRRPGGGAGTEPEGQVPAVLGRRHAGPAVRGQRGNSQAVAGASRARVVRRRSGRRHTGAVPCGRVRAHWWLRDTRSRHQGQRDGTGGRTAREAWWGAEPPLEGEAARLRTGPPASPSRSARRSRTRPERRSPRGAALPLRSAVGAIRDRASRRQPASRGTTSGGTPPQPAV